MERADESLVGRNIAGRYVIEALIGAGAMGSVYRAKQTEIGKRVAIKVLRPDLTKDASAVARFKREAKAASRIDHPSSVQMLDYGEHDGLCFLVMELLDGKSLFQIIKEEAPLAPERCAELARQVLAALAVGHDLGVVHRDLKPENIIVRTTRDDEGHEHELVKVCDFGVAKMGPARDESQKEGDEKLTSHGVIVGTPEYMSPEQARAEPLDGRSDLYAVGCMLYQMMTRKVPFSADQPVAVLLKHVIENPVPPSQITPNVDPRLEAVCLKAMSKTPEERFAGAREMRVALRPIAGGAPGPVDTGSQPRVRLTTESSAIPTAATMELASVSVRAEPGRTLKSQLEEEPAAPRRRLAQVAVFAIVAGAAAVALVGYLRQPPGATPHAPPAKTTGRTVVATPPPPPVSAAPSTIASAVAPRPSARASASAPAALPGTPPRVPTTVLDPLPSASASTTAPSAPPVEGPGKVFFGAVRSERAKSGDVLAALPHARFTACYKEALRSNHLLAGGGTLVLKMEADGWVPEASFAGPEALAEVGRCIVKASAGKHVANAQPGPGGAEVDLNFKPE